MFAADAPDDWPAFDDDPSDCLAAVCMGGEKVDLPDDTVCDAISTDCFIGLCNIDGSCDTMWADNGTSCIKPNQTSGNCQDGICTM